MPTTVVLRNRVVYASRDYRPRRRPEHPVDANGSLLDPGAIPADSPDSPPRMGEAWFDPMDGVEYRVVRAGALDPREGWAPLVFWAQRWHCKHEVVIELAQTGWLDAAVEHDSPTRRYRCRDEGRVRDLLRKRGIKPQGRW